MSLKLLADSLPDLLHTLRDHDFEPGHEQYLSAVDLFVIWSAAQKHPMDAEIRAGLSGIFCISADDQDRFRTLYDDWRRRVSPEQDDPSPEPELIPDVPPQLSWHQKFRRNPLLNIIPWLATLLVIGLLLIWLNQPVIIEPPIIEPSPIVATQPQGSEKPQPVQKVLIPPRPLSQHPLIPAAFDPWWAGLIRNLWAVPVAAWLLLMFWLLQQRHLILTRDRDQDDETVTLENLQLAPETLQFFNAPELQPFWRDLRAFRASPSKRLDVRATVELMVNKGGFFKPLYRDRQHRPAYLVLFDQHHQQDHSAGWSREFIDSLRREHLQVTELFYRGDPRHARLKRDTGVSRNPASLAGVYGDHDLIMLGDAGGLIDPQRDAPGRWAQVFRFWPHKLFLAMAPLWPQLTLNQVLTELGFRSAALTTPALVQLTQTTNNRADDDPHDLPLPRLFESDPLRWLHATGFNKKQLNEAVELLRSYLGREGFLLLAATATYPELRWQLTRALDLQLKLDADTREWRLRKLARLPWFRYGHMPNGLRYAIFRKVSDSDLEQITDTYNALLEHRNNSSLNLPVAIPEWRKQGRKLKQATNTAMPGTPLANQVMASVIRGRRPRQLEFALPLRALNRQIVEDWRALIRPLLVGALMIPAALWLNLLGWQQYGTEWARQSSINSMRLQSAEVQVTIAHSADLEAHAQGLARELRQRGFNVSKIDPIVPEQQQSQKEEAIKKPGNRILHAGLAAELIENLQFGLGYTTYNGSALYTELDTLVDANQSRVELVAMPDILQDELTGQGPKMARISAGCFQMGSPTSEADRRNDENQHEVCVKAFYMGRYEVTFSEYDAFTEATGREKPNDNGWGRGRRPVINVSWDDAVAYVQWLSQQSGQQYRLPTEAEWEYATRAGSTTAFWWGETISTEQANYNGNYAYNNGVKGENRQQTMEVGGFRPNPFGLYDVHGNVLEWSCSSYDEKYSGGETQCDEPGAGGTRVLRGGSWGSGPDWLRSAIRYNDGADFRYDVVGFRLARVIP